MSSPTEIGDPEKYIRNDQYSLYFYCLDSRFRGNDNEQNLNWDSN